MPSPASLQLATVGAVVVLTEGWRMIDICSRCPPAHLPPGPPKWQSKCQCNHALQDFTAARIRPQKAHKGPQRPTKGPRGPCGPLVGFAAWAFVGFDEKAHRQGGKKKTRRGGRPPTPAPGLVPKKYVNFQIWILECGLILDLRSNSGPPAQTCPGLDSSTA